MRKIFLLVLVGINSIIVSAREIPETSPSSWNDPKPIQAFDSYFRNQLDQELKALNVDLQLLHKEREAIEAELNQTLALSGAREFHQHYQPYYEQALVNMRLTPEAIRDALIDTAYSLDPSDFLSIIRYSYRCDSPLTLSLCNLLNSNGCTLQTIRPGAFNIFPSRQVSERYEFDGNAQGNLYMREDNIEPNTYRHIESPRIS